MKTVIDDSLARSVAPTIIDTPSSTTGVQTHYYYLPVWVPTQQPRWEGVALCLMSALGGGIVTLLAAVVLL